MVKTLRQLLTYEAFQSLVSATTYARGVAYAEQGRVIELTVTDTQLRATVQGEQLYQVEFWLRGGALHFSCTCPFAIEGACCKHCVAAGLEWLLPRRGFRPVRRTKEQEAQPNTSHDPIR